MTIQLLYFDGCPTHEIARRLLKEIVKEEGIDAPIEDLNVKTEEEARELRFLGSPSIRVNGQDIEKRARNSTDFGRKCRLYVVSGGLQGCPTKEMIRRALKGVKCAQSYTSCGELVSAVSGGQEALE